MNQMHVYVDKINFPEEGRKNNMENIRKSCELYMSLIQERKWV